MTQISTRQATGALNLIQSTLARAGVDLNEILGTRPQTPSRTATQDVSQDDTWNVTVFIAVIPLFFRKLTHAVVRTRR